MTPTPPPAWAMTEAREIVAKQFEWGGDATVKTVLSGAMDDHHPDIVAIARALADTAERVERETIERCARECAALTGRDAEEALAGVGATVVAEQLAAAIRSLKPQY